MITKTQAKALRAAMVKSSASLSDEDALSAPMMFDKWDGNGHEYAEGNRFRWGETLYKVRQAHTSQAHYTPDIVPALYEEVAAPGQGTRDNPIPYNNNMALEEGKYYSQYDVLYLCTRSTGVAVFNDLADLVNIYVTIVE